MRGSSRRSFALALCFLALGLAVIASNFAGYVFALSILTIGVLLPFEVHWARRQVRTSRARLFRCPGEVAATAEAALAAVRERDRTAAVALSAEANLTLTAASFARVNAAAAVIVAEDALKVSIDSATALRATQRAAAVAALEKERRDSRELEVADAATASAESTVLRSRELVDSLERDRLAAVERARVEALERATAALAAIERARVEAFERETAALAAIARAQAETLAVARRAAEERQAAIDAITAARLATEKAAADAIEKIAKIARDKVDRLAAVLSSSDGSQMPGELALDYLSSCTLKWSDANKIGEGVFGTVFKAVDKTRGLQFVVKRMNLASLSASAAAAGSGGGERLGSKMFQNEIVTLSKFRHCPFIVKLAGYTSPSEFSACLVYERCVGGSLDKALLDDIKAGELSWKQRVRVFSGVVKALHFLHKGGGGEKCYHRDVKSANICLTETLSPKLIDCGLAKFISDDPESSAGQASSLGGRPGTIGYMCPEYSDGTVLEFNESSEVFSLGVVLLELITGTITLMGAKGRNLVSHFVRKPKQNIEDSFDARGDNDGPCPADLKESLSELARRCLVEDSEERITLQHVMSEVNGMEEEFCRPVFTDALIATLRQERAKAALKSEIADALAVTSTRECQMCYNCDSTVSEGISCHPKHLHFYCKFCIDRSMAMELDMIMSTDSLLADHRRRDGKVRCFAHNECDSLYTDSQLSRALDEVRFAHYRAAQDDVFAAIIHEKSQEEMLKRVADIQRDANALVDASREQVKVLSAAIAQRDGDAKVAKEAAARLEEGKRLFAERQSQLAKEELARTLKKEFPNARQCGQCDFGPIDHKACWDLQTHQGERSGGSVIRNNCPRCGWTTRDINNWPKWNGQVS